jgi:hypothetical protein
MEKGDNG